MASFTLLLGLAVYFGVIVILPPTKQPLTAGLVDAIHVHAKADGCALPPSILVDIYHDKSMLSRLSHLKYIFFAGGPLPPDVGKTVASITHLSTLFGSTEIGFPIQEICEPVDWEYVKYSPFYGSYFRPFNEDGLYEHIFFRRRELDLFQSIFSTYPDLEVFSTKDLYRKHPTKPNLWKFCGRLDDIIVLSNAEKFNPVDFETMVAAHPAIKSAIVGGHGRSQTALLVEPMTVDETDDGKRDLLSAIWPTVVEANGNCPAHARIMKDFIIFVDKSRGVERAGKGTVQRAATLALYQADIDKLYEAPSLPNTSPKLLLGTESEESRPLRRALIDIVLSCIEPKGDMSLSRDFFELGLDSLQTISVAKQVNAYLMQSMSNPKLVTPQIIYSNPSIEGLESFIQSETDSSEHDPPEKAMQAIFEEFTRSLPKIGGPPISEHPRHPVVLLTGSTGSLGSYILHALLHNSSIAHIYCLTHGLDSFSRQTVSFESKGLKPDFEKVTFIPCDFSNPLLGLDESTYRYLQEIVTHIIHNAWEVNLYRCLEAFVTPHLSGVRYLIDFCIGSKYNAYFMFVSTQSTCLGLPGMRDKIVPEEPSFSWESAQSMGYSQSKLIAEQLSYQASKTSGLRSIVCRIGQIAGPTDEKGMWNLKEWFPSMIATSVEMGRVPGDLGTMNRVDWIPVNLVAGIIVELLFAAGDYLGLEGKSLSADNHDNAPISKDALSMNGSSKDVAQNVSQPTSTAASELESPVITASLTTKPIPNKPTDSILAPPMADCSSSAHPRFKSFNIVNPHTTAYPSLLPAIVSSLTTPLQVTPLAEWLQYLHHTSNTPEAVSRLPALKVSDFIHSFLRPEEAPKGILSTSEAVKYSQTMQDLVPVGERWVEVWMRQWGYGGSKEI
ncbi:MAG: hypothetical protein Q9219_006277 [cf. Caloplaca sp. 3 TL-2023]